MCDVRAREQNAEETLALRTSLGIGGEKRGTKSFKFGLVAMTGRTSQSANQDQDCCDAVSKRKFSTRIWLFPEDRGIVKGRDWAVRRQCSPRAAISG